MTPRQQETLTFIRDFTTLHGVAPSLREIEEIIDGRVGTEGLWLEGSAICLPGELLFFAQLGRDILSHASPLRALRIAASFNPLGQLRICPVLVSISSRT